jgi:hypothetical protein
MLIVSIGTKFIHSALTSTHASFLPGSGYTICGFYKAQPHSQKNTSSVAFDDFINIFFGLAVVQNIIVTGLIAYRIWSTDKSIAKFRRSRSRLRPILQILVESASLQVVVELLLLVCYSLNVNAQYILLEIITPVVVSVVGFIIT